MLAALKAEFRKLLTTRATYGIVIASVLIVLFFAGFIDGFQASPMALQNNPSHLASESTSAIVFVGLILAFAGLLLVGNEYRHNTIMYSLTTTNRRYKVLLAKVIATSVFAMVTALLVTFLSPLSSIVGAWLQSVTIGPQEFDYWSIIWRCVFCGWGYAMYALLLVAILRSQIGAIVTFLLTPLIGESILSLWLKHNTKYLPFNALQTVVTPPSPDHYGDSITPAVTHAALIVLVYVVIGLITALVLFQKRDAN